MVVVNYQSELCWVISEFCKKSKEAEKRVRDFKKSKGIASVKECKDVKALEEVLKTEIFISEKRSAQG